MVDGEFWSMTACAEHDPFLEPHAFRWRAGLTESEQEARRSKDLDSAELQHVLSKFGPKLLRVITAEGRAHRIRDAILSDDGKSVDLLLE